MGVTWRGASPHEIKNPLTPIQLSAERLKRRYLKQIKEDPETFSICTDTIIRQVGDIGRMVDEFSSFARMPRPTVQPEDAKELCQQGAVSPAQRQPGDPLRLDPAGSSCAADLRPPPDRAGADQHPQELGRGDRGPGKSASRGRRCRQGKITLALLDDDSTVRIVVEDNGKGLPKEGRERLTEPYMTTRSKGTGLGPRDRQEDHGRSRR